MSTDRFHYAIDSEGRSTRNTLARNEMGAFYIGNRGSVDTFEALPK